MLRQRVLTAVIGLPLIIALIWLGNPWFALIIAAAAIMGSYELYRMAGHRKVRPLTCLGLAVILLLVISPCCPYTETKPIIVTAATIISLIWVLFRSPKEEAFNNWAWTMAGIMLIGWTLSYWTALRDLETGREWTFWIMITIMINDSSAYFTGRAWGKRALAPDISPKKTWEGAIGGLVASIIVSIIFCLIFSLAITYWQSAILGGIISIFAQFGDLVESLIKRNVGVKDSGKLLPGHGGILDRIDSFILTGIVSYYFIIYAVS
jgi:phosphatidate cytidylyltransferase